MRRERKKFYLNILENIVKFLCAVAIVTAILILSEYAYKTLHLRSYTLEVKETEYVEKKINELMRKNIFDVINTKTNNKSITTKSIDDSKTSNWTSSTGNNQTVSTFNKQNSKNASHENIPKPGQFQNGEQDKFKENNWLATNSSSSDEVRDKKRKLPLPSGRSKKSKAKCLPLPPRGDDTECGDRVADRKCCEYIWAMKYKDEIRLHNKCVNRYFMITKGKNTEPGEFPHMAAVGFKVKNAPIYEFKCGGSLISERFVLTAGHCTKLPNNTDNNHLYLNPYIVRLGSENIKDENNKNIIDVRIQDFIKYPKYRPPEVYYDIALLRLKTDVVFTNTIHPACLSTDLPVYPTKLNKLNITGWGTTKSGNNKMSSHLLRGTIDVMSYKMCIKRAKSLFMRNFRSLSKHQICAGGLKNDGVDACQGDSGGPAQVRLNVTGKGSIHRVIAVTTIGLKCGLPNIPAIYISVSAFITWIERNVWPNEYQKYRDRWYAG